MIKSLKKRLLDSETIFKLKPKFLKAYLGSFLLQFILSLLTFVTTIVIARISGDKGFGIYSLVFTWVTVISSLALFGFDDLALKQISIYKSKNQFSEIKSFLYWGTKNLLFFSALIAFSYIIFCYLVPLPGIYEYRIFHIIAAFSIPFFTLVFFLQSVLKAFGLITIGQLSEKLIQPLSFIIIVICYYLFGFEVNDFAVILFRVISFILASIFVIFLIFVKLKSIYKSKLVKLESHIWNKSLLYFCLSTLLFSLNSRVDIIFLGLYSISPEEIAYYNVALKFSDIALIPFLVISTVSTPIFASMFHENKLDALQNFYTMITRIGFLIVFLIIVVFVSLGPFFLSWYGNNFQSAYTVLVLLCISKLVHVFVGPANYLLSMTGNEKHVTNALIFSVILTIMLDLILIPFFSLNGAAYASIGGLIFYDFYLAYIGFKKTGINFTIIGKIIK
jgi:O-antigen/teichoic acid export membrane protein